VSSWEIILTATTLFLSTGALVTVLVGLPDSHADLNAAPVGSFVTEIVWTGLYTLFIVLAFVRRQRLLAALLAERNICMLVGLAILSTLWSDSPSISLWNCARLIATTFFGIYLAKTYSLQTVFRMIAWATALSAVLSIVFALALPQYGLQEYTYTPQASFRGVFENKNLLGNIMALGALTWLIFALGAGRPRWLGVLLFTTCSLLVMLSASATSLVVECVLLFTIVAFAKVHRSVLILGSLCLIVLVAFCIAEAKQPGDVVLGLLNRDESLTGRVQIWTMVLEAISKHPWLGYGYHAFWRGSDGPSADIRLAWGQIPWYSHNGFLDLALDLGIAGPMLFVLLFPGPVIEAFRLAKRRTKTVDLFPMVFLIFLLLSNLTEGGNLTPHAISWDLLVMLRVKRSMTRTQSLQAHRRSHLIYEADASSPIGAGRLNGVAIG
jgi:O-antigen ligase